MGIDLYWCSWFLVLDSWLRVSKKLAKKQNGNVTNFYSFFDLYLAFDKMMMIFHFFDIYHFMSMSMEQTVLWPWLVFALFLVSQEESLKEHWYLFCSFFLNREFNSCLFQVILCGFPMIRVLKCSFDVRPSSFSRHYKGTSSFLNRLKSRGVIYKIFFNIFDKICWLLHYQQ